MSREFGPTAEEMGIDKKAGQIKKENPKDRILSDADMLRGGAEFDESAVLHSTDEQIDQARVEMSADFLTKVLSREEIMLIRNNLHHHIIGMEEAGEDESKKDMYDAEVSIEERLSNILIHLKKRE